MISFLLLISQTRMNMHLGQPFKTALLNAISGNKSAYGELIQIWLAKLDSGQDLEKICQKYPQLTNSPIKQLFLKIAERNIKEGGPVEEVLGEIEQELLHQIENSLERKIQLLPLKLTLLLVLFVLPSVVLLLIAPLIINLGGFL